GQPLHVTVSCGLAEPIEGETTNDLLRRADLALYASKRAGRNCSYWNDGDACQPIPPTIAAAGEPHSSLGHTIADPPRWPNVEMEQACSELRAKLVEVMQ